MSGRNDESEARVDQLDAPPIEEDRSGVFYREGDQLGARVVVGGSDDGFGDTHQRRLHRGRTAGAPLLKSAAQNTMRQS